MITIPSHIPSPTKCDPGHYCLVSGLGAPNGLCHAGFVCLGGASDPEPRNGTTGGLCPAGHYCEAGSAAATPCPIGTFSSAERNEKQEDCRKCSEGSIEYVLMREQVWSTM